jgi:uncharacterized protein YukE
MEPIMKDDFIRYPFADMHETASTQHTQLNQFWLTHQAHLNQHILSPASLLMKEASDPFQQHINSWNTNLEQHYHALHSFLSTLDLGATAMETADHNTSLGFDNGPSTNKYPEFAKYKGYD